MVPVSALHLAFRTGQLVHNAWLLRGDADPPPKGRLLLDSGVVGRERVWGSGPRGCLGARSLEGCGGRCAVAAVIARCEPLACRGLRRGSEPAGRRVLRRWHRASGPGVRLRGNGDAPRSGVLASRWWTRTSLQQQRSSLQPRCRVKLPSAGPRRRGRRSLPRRRCERAAVSRTSCGSLYRAARAVVGVASGPMIGDGLARCDREDPSSVFTGARAAAVW
jgi:hypothetical protein